MEKKNKKLEKELNILLKKNEEIKLEKDKHESKKETMKVDLSLLIKDFERWKKSVDDDKKDIEGKMRERDFLNKDVVTAEEKEREKDSVI